MIANTAVRTSRVVAIPNSVPPTFTVDPALRPMRARVMTNISKSPITIKPFNNVSPSSLPIIAITPVKMRRVAEIAKSVPPILITPLPLHAFDRTSIPTSNEPNIINVVFIVDSSIRANLASAKVNINIAPAIANTANIAFGDTFTPCNVLNLPITNVSAIIIAARAAIAPIVAQSLPGLISANLITESANIPIATAMLSKALEFK